jgi:uncharacterized protein (DUF952 family)
MEKFGYKIERRADWDLAKATGVYGGSALDQADGFIHLSARHQVRATLETWFSGQAGLVLATIDLAALGDKVLWEASRDGALFPHCYGSIPFDAVTECIDLAVLPTGHHDLPADFP